MFFFFYDRVRKITRRIRIKPLSFSFCFKFSSWKRNCNWISHDFYQQLPFPETTTTTRSTLLIDILLITTISLCSIPTVLSHSNPIRLSTQHNNNNNNNNDDACGEWSRTPPVSSCPVKCFRPDPFCGMDGVTYYWCGCDDARCAETEVAKKGFCEVGNNGAAAAQALLLVHLVWLIVHGFSIFFGFFWFPFLLLWWIFPATNIYIASCVCL